MNGPFRKRKPKFVESDSDDEEWKPGSSADKTNRKTGQLFFFISRVNTPVISFKNYWISL